MCFLVPRTSTLLLYLAVLVGLRPLSIRSAIVYQSHQEHYTRYRTQLTTGFGFYAFPTYPLHCDVETKEYRFDHHNRKSAPEASFRSHHNDCLRLQRNIAAFEGGKLREALPALPFRDRCGELPIDFLNNFAGLHLRRPRWPVTFTSRSVRLARKVSEQFIDKLANPLRQPL